MPLLYESTDHAMRKPFRYSPDFISAVGIFAIGVVTGLIIVPIVVPIAGYQLTKRYGQPERWPAQHPL